MRHTTKAEDYFNDEAYKVYRYVLRIQLPYRSPHDEAELLRREDRDLKLHEVAIRKKERDRRKARVQKAARRVLKLCGSREPRDVMSAVIGFMRPENGNYRSPARLAIIQEIFAEVKTK